METLSKLKGVIASGEPSGYLRMRTNDLYRRMGELLERKKLQQLVSRAGTPVRGAKTVAQELVEHWDRVSTPTGATEEDCVNSAWIALWSELAANMGYTLVAKLNNSEVVWIRSMRRNLCGSTRSPSGG